MHRPSCIAANYLCMQRRPLLRVKSVTADYTQNDGQ